MNLTMRAMMFLGACVAMSGCNTDPLPASDSYAQRFVGPWRVALAEDTHRFSDYVFAADGALTHLRSVRDGQTVDEMLGAGLVHGSSATQPTCVFSGAWYSAGPATIVVGGACTDGNARDIELDFADSSSRSPTQVTAGAVGSQSDWMRNAAWRFQRCDLSACRD